MSGFVANSPAGVEEDIQNIDFYPAISLVDCRAVMRLDQSITEQRLRHSLIDAITNVNKDLRVWKAEQEALGHATLSAASADQIGGESVKVHLYTRAVYSFAKAELAERYRDYDSTLSGSQRAEDLDETIDQYRRQAIVAIRSIKDLSHSNIELI